MSPARIWLQPTSRLPMNASVGRWTISRFRELAGSAGANIVLQVTSAAAMFPAAWIMSQWLGPDGMGVYAFGFAAASLAGMLGRLGLEPLVVRESAVFAERGDGKHLNGLTRFSLGAVSLASVGLGLLVTMVWAMADPAWESLATGALAMGLMIALSVMTIQAALLRGLGHTAVGNVPMKAVRPVGFVIMLAVGWLVGAPDAAWTAMALHVAAALAAIGVGEVMLRQRWPSFARGVAGVVEGRDWLTSGLPLLVLGAFLVMNRQTDILMLRMLASDAETGSYSVVVQLTSASVYLVQASNMVVAPRFAVLHANRDREGLRRLLAVSTRGVALAALPFTVVAFVAAEPLLGLFGPEFVAAALAMQVLAVGGFLQACSAGVVQLLLMTRQDRPLVALLGGTAVVNILLNALWIPLWGTAGAALATTTAALAGNAALVAVAWSRLRLDATFLGIRAPE